MEEKAKNKTISVVISRELEKEAKHIAADMGKSFSSIVREALNEYILRHKGE